MNIVCYFSSSNVSNYLFLMTANGFESIVNSPRRIDRNFIPILYGLLLNSAGSVLDVKITGNCLTKFFINNIGLKLIKIAKQNFILS